MRLYTPTKEETVGLLAAPTQFRGLSVCAEALPPAFLLERAIEAKGYEWLVPRLFVDDGLNRIVGAGGFKHLSKDEKVEIGYGVAPACRGQGYATQGVILLCVEAFASGLVREILAETAVSNMASERVLVKAGFACHGLGTDADGPIKLWSKKKDSDQSA